MWLGARAFGEPGRTPLGADGRPIVSYFDPTTGSIEVKNNPIGASTSGLSAIAVGTDGVPVVAYVATNGDLRIARCGNPTCSTVASDIPADTAVDVGRLAIAMRRARSSG